MKLHFKQRFFSWFDSYDIFDENGEIVYTVEGQFSWGHCLHILDADGEHIGTVKQVIFTLLPQFELYEGEEQIGTLHREFALFTPQYSVEGLDWHMSGNLFEWDYSIVSESGRTVAVINKELFNWTDTYTIEVEREEDALYALMVTLAIDAEKCSRDD